MDIKKIISKTDQLRIDIYSGRLTLEEIEKEIYQVQIMIFQEKDKYELNKKDCSELKLSNLLVIQDYLLSRGANDEEINEQIKQLKR